MPQGYTGLAQHVEEDLSTMSLRCVSAFDPEHIFHLAASFERTIESPDYWDVGWRDDVTASHRIISAAVECPSLAVFVFASSYLTYDRRLYLCQSPPATPIRIAETASVDPRNLCGAGKYYTERELQYTVSVRRPDLRVCNARIYRVYGQGSRDVISRWVRALMAGDSIAVYNAESIFDYVYAGDVAEVLARLAVAPQASGVCNVATGRGTSIRDVIAALGALGLDTERLVTRTPDAPPYEASVADISRLRDVLGWAPTTDIRAGVAKLIAHEE